MAEHLEADVGEGSLVAAVREPWRSRLLAGHGQRTQEGLEPLQGFFRQQQPLPAVGVVRDRLSHGVDCDRVPGSTGWPSDAPDQEELAAHGLADVPGQRSAVAPQRRKPPCSHNYGARGAAHLNRAAQVLL